VRIRAAHRHRTLLGLSSRQRGGCPVRAPHRRCQRSREGAPSQATSPSTASERELAPLLNIAVYDCLSLDLSPAHPVQVNPGRGNRLKTIPAMMAQTVKSEGRPAQHRELLAASEDANRTLARVFAVARESDGHRAVPEGAGSTDDVVTRRPGSRLPTMPLPSPAGRRPRSVDP
jgi:hypothetical protein